MQGRIQDFKMGGEKKKNSKNQILFKYLAPVVRKPNKLTPD